MFTMKRRESPASVENNSNDNEVSETELVTINLNLLQMNDAGLRAAMRALKLKDNSEPQV